MVALACLSGLRLGSLVFALNCRHGQLDTTKKRRSKMSIGLLLWVLPYIGQSTDVKLL